MGDWQPIDTAPKGLYFDVWCVNPETKNLKGGVRFSDVCFRGDGSGLGFLQFEPDPVWYYLDGRDGGPFPEWVPTHWMVRPEPPKEVQ